MSYQPHLSRNHNELYHSRPKGSRNGYTTMDNYIPKGKKANFIVRAGKRIYESAGRLWDGQAGAGTGRDAAANYRNYEQRNIKVGDKGAALEYHKKARNADNAYDRSIVGRFNSARRSVGNWLNDRGMQARNLINRAGRTANSLVSRARTAVGNAWDGKAGAGSGKSEAARLREDSMNYRKSGDSKKAISSQKAANNAQSAYDRSIVGRFNAARDWMGRRASDAANLAGRAGRTVGDAASRARTAVGNAWDGKAGKGSAREDAARLREDSMNYRKSGDSKKAISSQKAANNAQSAYDRSIKGRIERAGRDISNWAGNRKEDAKSAYRRSGAGNTAKTLTTKGPIQVGKNIASDVGGREAQQAKGNKLNVQNANRSAQERKQYVQQVDRDWGNAQRQLDRLTDKANSAKNENERNKALANIDRFMSETYRPAQTAYNNVHKKKK